MPSNKLKEIAALKAEIAELEKAVAAEQKQKLANLHTEAGFESTEALIAALKGLKAPRKVTASGRKSRAKITDALKAEVGKAVEAGQKGMEIARKFGISIPSIQNIKAELGLVKKRSAATVATKSAPKVAKKAAKKAVKKVAKKAAKKAAKK
jgi:hypothetical protein